MDNPSNSSLPVSDEEIVADLFRLARSGRFREAKALLAAGEQMYPNEPKERLRDCLRRLSKILWDADHGGYATEYKRQRRHPRSSLAAGA
ncbi:hypothetical protein [Stutzerimonas stutzeri]|uniref:hypothetical protein n=1 Tax=Stutzerimonas stutzeri TaxID=316 RepID=UPI001BCE03E6|nr:hypothetical protein [Stutzerimonas stutzeri]